QHKLKPLDKDICLYCGKPSFLGFTHEGCKRAGGVDGFLSIFFYNPILKKIWSSVKYRSMKGVAREMFSLIEPSIIFKFQKHRRLVTSSIIEPIPLHKKRIDERGFNQSDFVARFFSEVIKVPIHNSLVRTKPTLPQAQIKEKEKRFSNMRGAFVTTTSLNIESKQCILVDDIVTTGSTVKEAAKVLKKSGATHVFVYAVGHG
ncbi:MAG: phosphoribosyltransferase family protein, partial [bacterium]|nr:phosphoribosyltransferase family protein [bacterium]